MIDIKRGKSITLLMKEQYIVILVSSSAVEQATVNRPVVGSIPTSPANFLPSE